MAEIKQTFTRRNRHKIGKGLIPQKNMFIQGNILGFALFVLTGIFVAIGGFVLKFPDWIVMSVAGLILTVTDLILRILQRQQKGWLMAKNLGGYLYFIPVWVFGIVVVALNLISHFTKK